MEKDQIDLTPCRIQGTFRDITWERKGTGEVVPRLFFGHFITDF